MSDPKRVVPEWETQQFRHTPEEMKAKGREMPQDGAGTAFSGVKSDHDMVICETGNGDAYDAGTYPRKSFYTHQSPEVWDHTPNSDKVTDRDGFRRGGNEE